MATISLCMIVKNEAAILERCMDTVYDLVDEIIIVDTGSSDNTKEIAGKYTDKVYDFTWIDDFAAARNYSFSKATMEYIYAPDADEILDETNRERFRQMKKYLLPEIEMVQMTYLTESENNTVMNAKREYRPKLFKRLRTFTWIDPIHETVRLDPVVYDSDIEIIHRPQASHGKRDFFIFEKSYVRDGGLSKKVQTMYAKELFKCGDDEDFLRAVSIFEAEWKKDPMSDAGKEAACVLAHQARVAQNAAALMKYALRDMLETPCAEVCYELGAYYEAQKDYHEAIVWYQNAVEETSCILDVCAGGSLPLQGLVNCYGHLIDACGDMEKHLGQTPQDIVAERTAYRERLEHYKNLLEHWSMPEEL